MLKAIGMCLKRLFLLILLLAIGCQQTGAGANNPAPSAENAISDAELSTQLKINRDALFKGSSQQIRIDAASVMLFSDNPIARKILILALRQSENSDARAAVCLALSQARAIHRPVSNNQDFIQPLFDVLITEDADGAKLAAEAALVFDYEQISKLLEEAVADAGLSVKARLNVIYALRLQPDRRAIFALMARLDDDQSQIAAEAEKALILLGIPVAGKDAGAREEIIEELKQKGRDKFQRERLIRQEARMGELQKELGVWRLLYLAALDRIYTGTKEETAKAKILADNMASPEAAVRLWALEKVEEWRKGTSPQLPAELEPVLINLIADTDRDVRLKIAGLLSLMGQVNSSAQLLAQLEVETDDEVKGELLIALGQTCYYAFLPNSGVKLSPEIRKQTLKWAERFLGQADDKNAQKGAEVIKKLLEEDGLEPGEANRYLGLLAEKYRQQDQADGGLRGDLLSAMAGLCAQSVYKAQAVKQFRPLFEKAVFDQTDLVREAAVGGLINIDKARAIETLRKDEIVNDSSGIVRKQLIELAGEVGGRDDLVWLDNKIGSGAESEQAWQSMVRIFRRSGAETLDEWARKLEAQNGSGKLSDEQMIAFLEIAELKAVGENKTKMLYDVRGKLAAVCSKTAEYERAAEYLGMLHEAAETAEQKKAILAQLLDVYLKWPNIELAGPLIANYLAAGDLEPGDAIAAAIEKYFANPPSVIEGTALLEALGKIEVAGDKPVWKTMVESWQKRFGKTDEPQ